jgi:tetratricopeptide (TPR) repeat protein
MDDLDEARMELEEAFALEPENDVALANLAFVYEKMRDYEQALELYERAIMMGVDIDWALQRKAAVETELGEYEGARQTLQRYLSLAPDDGAQWVALGILHSDDEQYDAALDCYRRAEELLSDTEWLNLNWGVTAVRAGRLAEAEQRLDALRAQTKHSPRTPLLEAFIVEERGDLDEARVLYETALQRTDPEDVEDFSYTHEMAIDFFARRGPATRCDELFETAYRANALSVELCEAYREARHPHADEAHWFSVLVEAQYRPGLVEVVERGLGLDEQPNRFLRNFQVIAHDRDDAIALVRSTAERFGEKDIQVREFVADEPVEDSHLGIYEIERRSFVFRVNDK